MFEKKAITQTEITDLLAKRWSGRAYDAQRRVRREDLIKLLEAARWAPSCFGDQPWRYLVWDRHRDEAQWRRAADCLSEGNRAWATAAPVLMAACADSRFLANDKPNRWGEYDTGAASMSLCVQATALDLMVHQMGGFDAEALRAQFAIPQRFTPMAMIAVGYQVSRDAVPEALEERELAARARRPLGSCFFEGAWERPIDA